MSKKSQQKRLTHILATRQQRLTRLTRHRLPDTAETGEHLIRAQAGATLEILSEGCTAAKALEVGTNVQGFMDGLLTEAWRRQAPQLACRAGCWWCCTLPVAISPTEALALAGYLRAHLAAEALTTLTATITAQASRVAGLTTEAHAEARLPCALLQEGQCLAYTARPLACRGWFSTDAAQCEAGYWQPWTSTVLGWRMAFATRAQLAAGLRAGCDLAQVDGQSYELHSALARALTAADAAERWARGEAVFAGCTPGPQPSQPFMQPVGSD